GKLTTPKEYKNFTLRLEFRGKGVIHMGNTSLDLNQANWKNLLHPEGQFNYVQVKVADGKGKVWLNTGDLIGDLAVNTGPIAIISEKNLEVRNFRIRAQ